MRNYTERNNNRQAYYDEQPPRRGRPYGNERRRHVDADRGGRRREDGDGAPARDAGSNMDLSEWTVAHRVRVQHITVTIWQRRGESKRPTYSLTLVRTFWSDSRRGYLSTTKLFAEDAPLAAEAFRQAEEWLRQGGEEEPIPF